MEDGLLHLWCPDHGQSLCGIKQEDWEACEAGEGFETAEGLECIVCTDLYRPTRKYRCCKKLVG